jgi:hypothetical protein
MTTKFAKCYPLGDGNMCCEHWNGSVIVFPMTEDYRRKKQKPPNEENSSNKAV